MKLIYSVYETEADLPASVTDGRVRDRCRIKTSSRATWDDIYQSGVIPKHWAVHPRYPSFGLNNWNPKQIKPLVWEADAEYLHVLELDPLNKPTKISFDGTLIEEPTFTDNKKRLTTNTAGQLFTGIMEQVPIMDYSARFYRTADEPWMQTYLGAVNSDAVKLRGITWQPRTVLVGGITGSDFDNINGRWVSEYTMRLMANPKGWSQTVLNRGTVQLVNEYNYTRVDEQGNPINPVLTGRKIQSKITDGEPMMLDLNGKVVLGWLDSDIDLSKVFTRTFHIQAELPFKKLPLS